MRTSLLKITTIAAVVLGLGLVAAPAGAASATRVADSGFWWQGNTGVGVQTAPPDVERGQLLLEASPTGATAIAAVRAELKDGQGNPTLTLRIASAQGASTATILACQAGSGWTGQYSGRFDSAPSAACDAGSVQGLISEDGLSFAFPLGPLQFGDEFNVVLVAGANAETGATTPFRVVFEQPETTDIATVADAPAPSGPDRSSGGFTPPAPASGTSSSGSGASSGSNFSPPPSSSINSPSPVAVPSPTPSANPTVSPVAPAIPSELQGETATAPFATQQSLPEIVEVVDREIGRLRLLGLLVLVLGTATGLLWWRAEGSVPLRAVFTGVDGATLAQLNAAHAGEGDDIEGGLGRFRRNRAGSAPRLF